MYLPEWPPSAELLAELVVQDAEAAGTVAEVVQVGRLTAVHGSPDWFGVPDEALFRNFVTLAAALRPYVLLAAAGTVVFSWGRDGHVEVVGGAGSEERLGLKPFVERSERVVVFAMT